MLLKVMPSLLLGLLLVGCGEAATTGTTAPPQLGPPVHLSMRGFGDGTISVESSPVLLQGQTEPGASVSVDGQNAKVAADGEWSAKIHVGYGTTSLLAVARLASRHDGSLEGELDRPRPEHVETYVTPPKRPARRSPTKRSVPLARWANSSFRGGYLAGRRECSIYSVAFLAQQYGVHPDIASVTEAFGEEHGHYNRDPSLDSLAREAADQGCLEGFEIQGVR
jgi:hypothetical protein